MFGTLVLGIIAGAAVPFAEPHIKKILENVAMAEMPLSHVEMRAVAVSVCLLVGAILATLLSSGSAIALTLGGALGIFGPRLIARARGD